MKLTFAGAVLIASLFGFADAGCQIYSSTYTSNGTFCVDENARNLWTALNDFRVKGITSTYYTGSGGLLAACTSILGTAGTWTSSANLVSTKDTTTASTASCTYFATLDPTKVSLPKAALNWSIGLSAAGQDLFNDYITKGTKALTDSNG